MSELLDNTAYVWMFILGGAVMSFGLSAFVVVLVAWMLAALVYMYQYDPTAVVDGE